MSKLEAFDSFSANKQMDYQIIVEAEVGVDFF